MDDKNLSNYKQAIEQNKRTTAKLNDIRKKAAKLEKLWLEFNDHIPAHKKEGSLYQELNEVIEEIIEV